MTVLYVASTAALLVLTSGFLYWALKRNLDTTRHAMLASKIEVLQLLLKDPDKANVLTSEVEHEASGSGPLKYYVRILDEQNQILQQTPGMEWLGASLFPSSVEIRRDALDSVKRGLTAHNSFLLLAVQVVAAGDQRRTVQMALDVSPGDLLLADYRLKLLAVLILGLAFAAVAGVWVARKGMRPLVSITKAAQHVTASQLHDRITGSQWPAELADLAAAFDAMLNRLEDSFKRLSDFSADLAHALRSPINNLRGEAEVSLGRTRTPEKYQQTLASALEEYERLSRMIDDLLFLARADNPNAAVKQVQFDARKEIDAVQEFYEALAEEHGVEVTCEGTGCVTGDPMLFRRAVSNLLANALRHTHARGHVRIQLHPLDTQGMEVTVRDSGLGIAPEHLSKIFDRFYRIGDSSSLVPGGTGLGLAIVQSIMRLHGGTACVQSTLGQGTAVTLKFPDVRAN